MILASELKQSFLIKYDRLANLAAPGYTDEELSSLANSAQDRLLAKLYNPLANKYQLGFEGNEKRRRDLANLIVTTNVPVEVPTLEGDIHGNNWNKNIHYSKSTGYTLQLANNVLYIIEEGVTLGVDDNEGYQVQVKPVTHDYVIANINNPYKQPNSELVWRLTLADSESGLKTIELICNDITPATYFLRYIKYPVRIDFETNVNCELDQSLKELLIDEMVLLASAITTTQDYQIKMNERNSSE